MGFFLVHIKVNIQLFTEKCLFLNLLKPPWVPHGTITHLWETQGQGIALPPRFHICLTGSDVPGRAQPLI